MGVVLAVLKLSWRRFLCVLLLLSSEFIKKKLRLLV